MIRQVSNVSCHGWKDSWPGEIVEEKVGAKTGLAVVEERWVFVLAWLLVKVVVEYRNAEVGSRVIKAR
jgi:hypothetical protein